MGRLNGVDRDTSGHIDVDPRSARLLADTSDVDRADGVTTTVSTPTADPFDSCARRNQTVITRAGIRRSRRTVRVNAVDGVQLYVDDYGARTARHTVVFLHGLCLNKTSWTSQIDYLLRRDRVPRSVEYWLVLWAWNRPKGLHSAQVMFPVHWPIPSVFTRQAAVATDSMATRFHNS